MKRVINLVLNNKFLYYILTGILTLILLYLIIKLFPAYKVIIIFIFKITAPFIIASFISYLIYPIIKRLQEANINKVVAISIIYLFFFSSIGLLIYFGIPVFINQLNELSEQLPHMIIVGENIIYSLYEYTSFLPEFVHDKMDIIFKRIEKNIGSSIENILELMTNIFDIIVLMAIIPVLVFYLLKDYDGIKGYVKKLINKRHHKRLSLLIYAVDKSLGNYIRGQFLLSFCITIVTYIVYHLIDLKYALLLAILMGLFNIIPYFGPIIGIIPALLIASSMSWTHVLIVGIAALIIQIIEGSFLSPYIMGKSVHIHPIVIIFALLLGAEIGSIVGMIIAVPTLTIIREVIVQFIALNRAQN